MISQKINILFSTLFLAHGGTEKQLIALIEGLDKTIIDIIYEAGWCLPEDVGIKNPIPNHYFILKNGKSSVLAFYNPLTERIEKIEKKENPD